MLYAQVQNASWPAVILLIYKYGSHTINGPVNIDNW